MLKAEVEFKHSKRMKKRRQLDALVDNIKLPRGRKNSASAHELLDQHSDSSDADDYSVSSSGPSKKKFCFCEGILSRISLLMVSLACISICIGLMWVQWHVCHELTLLRDQVAAVQKSDAANTITKLQNNLATLNRSVTELKTTAGKMTAQFEDINKKMEDLEKTKAAFDGKLDKAEKNLNLPTIVNSLKQTVAELGSDMVQIRNKDIKDLQKDIQDLQGKVTANEPKTSDNGKELSNIGPLITNLQDEVKAVNQTLNQEIAAMQEQVSEVQEAIEALTSVESSDADLRTESLTNTITETVMKILKNKTFSNNEHLNNQTEDLVNRDITELWTKKADFLLFKEEMLIDIKNVKLAIVNFSEEFDDVQKHLIFNHDLITNLSILVERNSQNKTKPPTASETSRPLEIASAKPTARHSEENDNTENSEIGKSEEESVGEVENKLKIDGLNNETAVHEFFEGYNTEEMNGSIPIAEFAQHLNQTVQDLTQYDKDGDNFLTEHELQVAMGFHSDTKKRIKRDEW